MATIPAQLHVLFDESHSEAWTIRPEVAGAIQPAHPGDSSLERAARSLAEREFAVAAHTDGPLTDDVLAEAAVLVIAHPSDPKWEATVDGGSPLLEPAEIEAIEAFVRGGGGLIVLGETEQDKYGSNLNDLLARFGVRVESATVQDYEHHHGDAPSWVLAALGDVGGGVAAGADPLAGVQAACFYRAGYLATKNGARVIARAHPTASQPDAPLAAVIPHGEGRVVVLSDSDLFGDDCIAELDHEALWLNLVYWAAEPRFASEGEPPASPVVADEAWIRLKAAVEELRLTQAPDGSIDTAEHDPGKLRNLAAAIAESAQALKPRFPHQEEYIDALAADTIAWADGGFGKPAFDRSIEAFRPERDRRDGIEHLAVFPMYKQNASTDTCFEALVVRVPWPEWIAELERTRFDNPKFVPVTFVDRTSGYDSECAVLFPETFSTAERPADYHFGAIFCDREAERFRRVCGSAAEILRLNLPPDAACLIASRELSQSAYMLWDLVHDRTHMRGDLPFDPFMIRQRSPYWMYSLEELRCDLTAFAAAVELEREGFAFARHAQYAILFDRLFRFPVTGSRVRNYDGLGGQLLFAFLHREGYLHWTDNRLTMEWGRLAEGVGRLRDRVQDLYHSGIDRSKLGQWIAAHDLVAEYVPPTESSVWARERRNLPEVEEPKQLVDLVRDDEFPLSLFYTQLQPKLASALMARA
ncbi:MAG: hypothetical protein QOI10_2555 [Solirubrobacterales bacterium]|jgi:hypothetical protein|nr:hypothetical protein [Solirubrobacterales bacterium]